MLERAGGEISYTETEFAPVRAARGEHQIEGEVDRSGPGEPVVRVRLIPATSKGSMSIA